MKSASTALQRILSVLVAGLISTALSPILLGATELPWNGPATVRADAAALLFSGQNGGALALAVLPVPFPQTSEGSASVAVFVEVAGTSLLADFAGSTLKVEVFAYVVGEKNQVLAHRNGELEIPLDQHRQGLEDAGLALALGLDAPPGEHQIRLLVRRSAEVFGLRSLPLSIPKAKSPLLLPPLVQRPPSRWRTAQLGLPEDPDWAAGSWPPSSRVAWNPQSSEEFLTIGRSLPHKKKLKVHLTPVRASNSPLLLETKSTISPLKTQVENLLVLRHTLDSSSLSSGIYRLSLSMLDGAQAVKSAPIEVFLGDTESGPSPLWTDLLAQSTSGRESGRQAKSQNSRTHGDLPRPRRGELKTLYIEALQHLAAGPYRLALNKLQSLEERALHSSQAPGAERLATAQSAVLQELLEDSPQVLLPPLLLQAESAEHYIQKSRFQLADHAAELVQAWAELAIRSQVDESPRDIAHILNLLAAAYRTRGDLNKASKFFELALNHDSGNEAALLGLATIRDRLGDHDRAAPLFSRLLQRKPLHKEAQLRFAISHLHAGRQSQSKALLERLALSQQDWIAILAFQELARLATNGNDLDTADRVLRRGLHRFQQHPGLRLQRAALLERLGKGQEAKRLLAPLDAPNPSKHLNARVRFNNWPEESIEAGRAELRQRVKDRLGELHRALESLTGGP